MCGGRSPSSWTLNSQHKRWLCSEWTKVFPWSFFSLKCTTSPSPLHTYNHFLVWAAVYCRGGFDILFCGMSYFLTLHLHSWASDKKPSAKLDLPVRVFVITYKTSFYALQSEICVHLVASIHFAEHLEAKPFPVRMLETQSILQRHRN